MILRKILLYGCLVFCNGYFCLALGAEGTKAVPLVGDLHVVAPASMGVKKKIDMEDFAFYEFFDSKGKFILSMYLGNHATAQLPIAKGAIISEETINDLQIESIVFLSTKKKYKGDFYIRITDGSGWPNVAHIKFQNLSIDEYDSVRKIAFSLGK